MDGVGDEVAYSAYINALIEGRPRRSDPYTGRDDREDDPQPESLFSIQFVPAYMIALPARMFGVSAATAFTVLTPLAAGAASVAIFCLLIAATGDGRLAASGVLVVLCLGTLVAGHGHVVRFFGQEPLYNSLIFLRRYQPSATFSLFFIFCGLVWQSLTSSRQHSRWISATVAGIVFGVLVFSYVFLWTAAAVWLGCIALLWMLARPEDWRIVAQSLSLIVSLSAVALIPFAILYSRRAKTLDAVQALEFLHRPDLFRLPELLAFALLAALGFCAIRKIISVRDRSVLLSASFALMTVAIFNQQVVTGRSLQPLHYEMFIANYSILIGLVLAVATICGKQARPAFRRKRILMWVAIAALECGAYEVFVATMGSVALDRALDDSRPVAMRLANLSRAMQGNASSQTVLCTDLVTADALPTSAPQSVLWAPHLLVFSGATREETKERFYQYLYFTGIDADRLKKILTSEGRYGFAASLFGFERTIKGLSVAPRPITSEELDFELRHYAEYWQSFTRGQAKRITLSYLLVAADDQPDLSNLDRWYERDRGETIGKTILYRLRFRDERSSLTD
jgi:hypothetical protein